MSVMGRTPFLCKKEKRQYVPELKLQAVHAYYERRESMETISKQFGIQDATVLRNWVMQYEAVGEAAFISDEKYVSYDPELKLEAVQTYNSGKGSLDDICQKFGIRNKITLQNWIARYTAEGELTFFPNWKRKRYEPEVKLRAVKAYLCGEGSLKEIGSRYGLRDGSVLRRWLAQYEMEGETAFLANREKSNYKPELKKEAVLAYQNGEGSLPVICKRFGIQNRNTLERWVKKYKCREDTQTSGLLCEEMINYPAEVLQNLSIIEGKEYNTAHEVSNAICLSK